LECHAASGHHLLEYYLFPTGRLNLGFITEEKLAAIFIKPSLGVSNWSVILLHQQTQSSFLESSSPHHQHVFWRRCWGIEEEEAPTSTTFSHGNLAPSNSKQVFWRHCQGKRRLLQGEYRTHILYFVLVLLLLYFYLHRFIKNTKKLVSFIVAFTCLLLVLLEWLLLKTPSCVILLARIIVILSALLLRHLLQLQIFMRLSLLY
jgi:hypothetical protein